MYRRSRRYLKEAKLAITTIIEKFVFRGVFSMKIEHVQLNSREIRVTKTVRRSTNEIQIFFR